MYLTEKEIGLEFQSVTRSVEAVMELETGIKDIFFGKKRCWFIGCGSSHTVGKSAASMMLLRCGIDAYAVAAGDMLLRFQRYEKALADSVVVFMSRSGCTSEVLKAAGQIRESTNASCISICARENSALDEFCHLNIHIPWAFDESVCQTRTVGSIYACLAAMTALISGDKGMVRRIRSLESMEGEFRSAIESTVRKVAEADWDSVVVLADSEASGIMEEGALAFKEICQVRSNFYNVLDVRHGPMVLIDGRTFVFVLLEEPRKMLTDLVADIKAKGACCVVSGAYDYGSAADGEIRVPTGELEAVCMFSLYFLQLTALKKALELGIDPDRPDGLSPWIEIS